MSVDMSTRRCIALALTAHKPIFCVLRMSDSWRQGTSLLTSKSQKAVSACPCGRGRGKDKACQLRDSLTDGATDVAGCVDLRRSTRAKLVKRARELQNCLLACSLILSCRRKELKKQAWWQAALPAHHRGWWPSNGFAGRQALALNHCPSKRWTSCWS